jgi:hypothetical protein
MGTERLDSSTWKVHPRSSLGRPILRIDRGLSSQLDVNARYCTYDPPVQLSALKTSFTEKNTVLPTALAAATISSAPFDGPPMRSTASTCSTSR